MARNMYEDVAVHCIVCGTIVPEVRLAQGAITCTKEHGTVRANMLRARKDARECRYCRKPSTPEERAAFQRFRKFEAKRPDLVYPAEFEAWKADLDAQANPENAAPRTPEAFNVYRKEKDQATEASDGA